MATTRTIRWLAGGGFVDKAIQSGTVGQLRSELEMNKFLKKSLNLKHQILGIIKKILLNVKVNIF